MGGAVWLAAAWVGGFGRLAVICTSRGKMTSRVDTRRPRRLGVAVSAPFACPRASADGDVVQRGSARSVGTVLIAIGAEPVVPLDAALCGAALSGPAAGLPSSHSSLPPSSAAISRSRRAGARPALPRTSDSRSADPLSLRLPGAAAPAGCSRQPWPSVQLERTPPTSVGWAAATAGGAAESVPLSPLAAAR